MFDMDLLDYYTDGQRHTGDKQTDTFYLTNNTNLCYPTNEQEIFDSIKCQG